MNTEQRQIPFLLRIALSVTLFLFAALAALSGIRGSSTMAWVALALFLSLGVGIVSRKLTVPSLLENSQYWPTLAVLLLVSTYLSWLIVTKLVR